MRAKTTSIPIVLAGEVDPVGAGLAHSLRPPGMNVTGITLYLDELAVKHIELMREILPRLARVESFSLVLMSLYVSYALRPAM